MIVSRSAEKKASGITNRPSGESRSNASKAGLISLTLRTSTIVNCIPDDRAAVSSPPRIYEDAQQVIVVFRNPAKLGVFSMRDGSVAGSAETCGDSDDVFVDTKRHRVYVSCGDGFLDVFDTQAGAYKRIAHVSTVSGARTSLFVPQLDRLLLAVRASRGEPA